MATWGMKNVHIMKTAGTWIVTADTERFGKDEIMFESYKFDEAIEYLKKNDVYMNDVMIDTVKAIKQIVHVSFAVDSYRIELIDGTEIIKTSRSWLSHAEQRFMDTHEKNESWIKNGGLRTVYVA